MTVEESPVRGPRRSPSGRTAGRSSRAVSPSSPTFAGSPSGVPAFARSVAWLHDVLEWTWVGERELAAAGLASDELAALRLLTRAPGEADDEAFFAEVRAIAIAPGRPGAIARAVKRADMEDRALHPRHPGGRWSPPYDRARRLLAELSAPGLMAGPRAPGAPLRWRTPTRP